MAATQSIYDVSALAATGRVRTHHGPRRRRKRVYRVAGEIELVESGVLETAERMEVLAARAQDKSTIGAGEEPVRQSIRRLFESHGALAALSASSQGAWKPTKPKTTREKRQKGLRTEPMRATDRLYQSLMHGPPHKGSIRRYRKKNTELLISSRYPEIVFQARAGRLATAIDPTGRTQVVRQISHQLLLP